MDMTKVPQKPIQKVIVSIFLLVCFGGILYIYSNPNSDSLRYPFANVYVNNSSTKTCLNMLQKEHFQCTKDKTTNSPSATTTASKDQQETIVLIWMWPFGAKFDLIPCSTRYNIHGCHITADRNLYDQAHGVLIHHRDIPGDLSSMPQTPRPYFQKWIWWNMESPTNTYANVMDTKTPTIPQKSTHKVIAGIFLLVCSGYIFYVYYNPNTDSLRYPFVGNQHSTESSTETCLHMQAKENYHSIKNEITNKTLNTTSALKPPAPASKDQQETIVLIWMWPFGVSFALEPCSTQYNIHGCHITADRNLYDQAHGVLIHHRDIPGDLSNMPQKPRPYFQKWIWWNMESPTNTYANRALKEVFNLTTSYRRTSDIYVPYGWLREATESEKNFTIPKKDKLVCWIVSHFEGHFRRSTYYYELVKHINVDAYGGHFKNRINDQDYSKIVSSCKFYLSFENSIHQDYFTEKVFNPLSLGTVPVVIGPPRQNYEMSIPSDSFIHVDDFPSPKELADHLKMLDVDEERYRQFFNWRKNFVSVGTPFGLEQACRVCYYLQQNKHYTVVKDLIGWFWG
ncbi:hypothetical protein DNTS_035650 [Danionella cerebrum]|uniref:Fucosyltransferase n=1 Tax=Danionella cerebrum TaxID=2873325 RepID=A0A553QXT1_9TELE|nr:hypothetical protein DNTS_035650 [Danionella translucida]